MLVSGTTKYVMVTVEKDRNAYEIIETGTLALEKSVFATARSEASNLNHHPRCHSST